MTDGAPLPSVPPPQKPPSGRRRVGGVLLGIGISVALSIVCGVALGVAKNAFEIRLGRYLSLALAFAGPQTLVAIPMSVWLWRKGLKATAMALAICSALTLLVSSACWGIVLWG